MSVSRLDRCRDDSLRGCRRIERLALFDLNNLAVVLVRPRNPLNIGAVARAMSNFGSHLLRVVNPYGVAFREARSAVGGSNILAKATEYASVADAVGDCTLVVGATAIGARNLQHPPQLLNEASGAVVQKALGTGPVALLFGSEKTGLSNDDLSHCHWLMTIATHQQNISMNLGQAVAVCLYELARSTPAESPNGKAEPAMSAKIEQITQCLLDALRISGYIKPGTDNMFEKKARQLILRFHLEAYDAKLLLGMVRQIVWKLKNPQEP